MTNCLHCGAETTNGLVLCDMSQALAARVLDLLPVYFRNLARWRPGRAGSRPVPGSRVLYDGETRGSNDRVARALDEVGNDLGTRARELADDRGFELPAWDTEAEQVAVVCRFLAGHLTSIGTLGWAGDFVTALVEHDDRLSTLTQEVAPGWYAGGCRQCGSGTYVVPGFTWVTCRACGVTTYARDHLETVLDEARDWVARPKALAEAIVALVDTEQSVPQLHDRIRQWSARGRLQGFRKVDDDGDEVGPRKYALGDVLDLLQRDRDARAARARAVAAEAS